MKNTKFIGVRCVHMLFFPLMTSDALVHVAVIGVVMTSWNVSRSCVDPFGFFLDALGLSGDQ
jgi:hypothetical protein